MNLKDRKAGYKAGVSASGEWLKDKLIGFIAKGDIILRKKAELKDDHYLFAVTKEEIEKLTNGELPG